ncbi:MAG: alpha-glucan phosphorylase, partial [Anaerolineae bacterium]|nr:alpha-glucan phosphorylase [Anaerolineae bacterium]
DKEYHDEGAQNHDDATSIYETLENEVVPAFYKRDKSGLPKEWLKIVKESIKTNAPQFSMSRMIKDYTTNLYVPAMED